jgi:UDP-glucose 4-epimerase
VRILITGARGMLGEHVVGRIEAEGLEAVAVGRADADIADSEAIQALRASIGPVDALVHLAARVPRTSSDDEPTEAIRANVVGTLNVLAAWAETPMAVLMSTVEVYGGDARSPIGEVAPTAPATFYGATKLAAEHVARVQRSRVGLPLAILRLASVYGVHDDIDRAIANFVRAAVAGAPLEVFGGEDVRDYVHVDDAAHAVVLAVRRNANGVYNIGSGGGVAIEKAARMIVERAGSRSRVVVHEPVHRRTHRVLDIRAARRDLGYRPRAFPAGIEPQIIAARARL